MTTTATGTTIQLRDTILFRDTGGDVLRGYVCCLPSNPLAFGNYNVSTARYQGLVAVKPEDVIGVVR